MSWLFLLRRLVVGWVLLYSSTSLLLGGHSLAFRVWLALVLGWSGFLLWQRLRTQQTNHLPPSTSWLELLGTNLACMLLLGELTLQLTAAGSGTGLLVKASLDAHRLVPAHDYGHGLRGNALGYPGPDWPRERPVGVVRIAALGDSFAVGPAVPFSDCYLTRLEAGRPGLEVLNFGVAGAGPREYLAVLQRDIWTYQPDLVLLSVFVGNDITELLATPRHLAPEQHALYLFGQRCWRLWRERQRQQQRTFTVGDRLAQPPLAPETYWEIEARRLQVCQTPVTVLEKKWTRTFRWLEQIATACRERNEPLALVLIPDEFQVNPEVMQEARRRAGVKTENLDLDLPQRRLHDFAHQQGLPCLDLLPVLRGRTDCYAPYDTHWNTTGNRLAAEAIGRWLEEEVGCKIASARR